MRVVRRTRTGFTLVELLVATGVTILIMVLLSEAFRGAISSFRALRASAKMQDKLRTASDILRRDLGSPHFDGPFQPGLSGPYLSDQRLDKANWMPPAAGFFRFWQASNTVPEGSDADQIPSTRASGNILHFTVQYLGNRRGDNFMGSVGPQGSTAYNAFLSPAKEPDGSTSIPNAYQATDVPAYNDTSNGLLATRWGEVVYFLQQTSSVTPGGMPLFTLYRRVRAVPLAVPANAGKPVDPPNGVYLLEISQDADPFSSGGNSPTQFVSLADLTDPTKRMGAQAANASAQGYYASAPDGSSRPPTWAEQAFGTSANPDLSGEDILITDVLSFEVKASWTSDVNNSNNLVLPPSDASTNIDFPFADLPTNGATNLAFSGVRVFDTWTRYTANLSNLANTDWGNGSTTAPVTPMNGPATPGGYMATGDYQVPLRIRITAFQIRIRIWDVKTQQSRQITIVQTV